MWSICRLWRPSSLQVEDNLESRTWESRKGWKQPYNMCCHNMGLCWLQMSLDCFQLERIFTLFAFSSSSVTLKAPITTAADDILKYFFLFFQRKQVLIFHVNRLLGRRFTWNIDFFLWKNKKIKIKCCLLQILLGALRVKSLECHIQYNDYLKLEYLIHTSWITAYLEVEIWSLPKHENLTTGKKYCGKEEKLLLRSNFSSFPQYFQYISNFKSPITHIFVKCGCLNYFFLNSANLICRGTDILNSHWRLVYWACHAKTVIRE